ncbi:MAG: adenine deaminase [Desulfobacteraceae bacterium]|nr:MAG: adenine deaminase [Desulfobacteraceae bacterium]
MMTYLNDTKSIINVASGFEPADMVITGGRIFNVFTGELLDGFSVAIKHGRIAYVGTDPENGIGPDTMVMDADGKTLIPGLIDGHTHMAWMNTPEEFLKLAMSGGTTTIITEIFEPCPVAGIAGILELLDAMQDQPVKIFATAPAMVSISQRTRGISAKDLDTLLLRPDVLGLGESYWQGVLQEPDIYLPQFEKTLAFRKTLEGHSAGANEKRLNAYAATGISSCHEPIKADEALDRLRLGMVVMVREGSVRRELEAISEIQTTGIDLRRMILVSDGISAVDLKKYGYMESIVQKAINLGFKPEDAIRMATLNVAEHFSLDGQIGAIAPGRYADILIIPNIKTIRPEIVISNGVIISQNGYALAKPRPHQFSQKSRTSVQLPRTFTSGDFAVTVSGGQSSRKIHLIEMVTDLVTREWIKEMPVIHQQLRADVSQDILKITAIDRAIVPGDLFTGFIRGFGLRSGAMAVSATWDSADIIVIGANDADMATAVNRLHELQGGVVVCENGKIRAELGLPIFGVISDLPVDTVAEAVEDITKTLTVMGVPHPDPIKTSATLTSAAIPFFKICEEGYVRMKDGATLGLFADKN